jgi:hypothetical protein
MLGRRDGDVGPRRLRDLPDECVDRADEIVSAIRAALPATVTSWEVNAQRRDNGAWNVELTHEASNGLVFETPDVEVADAITRMSTHIAENDESSASHARRSSIPPAARCDRTNALVAGSWQAAELEMTPHEFSRGADQPVPADLYERCAVSGGLESWYRPSAGRGRRLQESRVSCVTLVRSTMRRSTGSVPHSAQTARRPVRPLSCSRR